MTSSLRDSIISVLIILGAVLLALFVAFCLVGWLLDGFNVTEWSLDDPSSDSVRTLELICDRWDFKQGYCDGYE